MKIFLAIIFLVVSFTFAEDVAFDESEEDEGSGHVSCRHEFHGCIKAAAGDREKYLQCLATYLECQHDKEVDHIRHCVRRCYEERKSCRSFRFICDMRLKRCKYGCFREAM